MSDLEFYTKRKSLELKNRERSLKLKKKHNGEKVYLKSTKSKISTNKVRDVKDDMSIISHVKSLNSDVYVKRSDSTFVIKCSENQFSDIEEEILYCYGTWLSELTSGKCCYGSSKFKGFVLTCNDFRRLNVKDMYSFLDSQSDLNEIYRTWLKYIAALKYDRDSSQTEKKIWDWGWQGAPALSKTDGSKFFS